MIRIIKFIFAIGLFIGLQQLIEIKTHGFCLQKIQTSDLPFRAKWETAPLAENEEKQIADLLSEPFRMIGAGSECFAFVSEDGNTVIKFFKLDHARPVYLHRGIFSEDHSKLCGTLSDHPLTKSSFPWVKRWLGMREYRINRTFSSIKLAYDELKNETGLIYLHLNPTNHLQKELIIYDACGIRHKIDLDSSKFFLQKRAIPLEKHFSQLKEKQATYEAQKSIDSLIELLITRCKKGFADRDIVNRNFGYIGTQAIEIDSGSFLRNPRMKEPPAYKQEIFYATLELKIWLKKNYPEMVGYLEDRVNEQIHQGHS